MQQQLIPSKSHKPIVLRDYQVKARDKIIDLWREGKRPLAVATMGLGKTEVFLGTLTKELQEGRLERALVIAHTKELIEQPVTRIKRGWPELAAAGVGVVMANRDEYKARIVVATIQTLSSPARLQRVLSAGRITHVVVDETHHVTARTYLEVLRAIEEHNPTYRLLGVTATPKRTDGDGLSRVFDAVACKYGIVDAVKMKALVPFRALAVEVPVSLAGAEKPRSEDGYDNEEVGRRMMTATELGNPEEVIVETWKKHGENRKTIAFCASVKQAHSLARAFNDAGIPAAAADGTTAKAERAQIVEGFRAGTYKVLANCALWTEGFDVPDTSCVLMAKPTKSDLVYMQSAGRGLRLFPGKQDCLILDFVPMDSRDLRMAGDLLGKPKETREAEKKARKKGVVLECFALFDDGSGIDGDPDEVRLRVLDFLGNSRFCWLTDGEVASVSIGAKKILAVVLPQKDRLAKADALKAAGTWNPLWDEEYERISSFQVFAIVDNRATELVGLEESWDIASEVAEEYAEIHGEPWAAAKSRKWRNNPAKPNQAALARRLGVWVDGMTAGECSQAITHWFARSALYKNRIIKSERVAARPQEAVEAVV